MKKFEHYSYKYTISDLHKVWYKNLDISKYISIVTYCDEQQEKSVLLLEVRNKRNLDGTIQYKIKKIKIAQIKMNISLRYDHSWTEASMV